MSPGGSDRRAVFITKPPIFHSLFEKENDNLFFFTLCILIIIGNNKLVVMEMKTLKQKQLRNFQFFFRMLNMKDFKRSLDATRKRVEIMTVVSEGEETLE